MEWEYTVDFVKYSLIILFLFIGIYYILRFKEDITLLYDSVDRIRNRINVLEDRFSTKDLPSFVTTHFDVDTIKNYQKVYMYISRENFERVKQLPDFKYRSKYTYVGIPDQEIGCLSGIHFLHHQE